MPGSCAFLCSALDLSYRNNRGTVGEGGRDHNNTVDPLHTFILSHRDWFGFYSLGMRPGGSDYPRRREEGGGRRELVLERLQQRYKEGGVQEIEFHICLPLLPLLPQRPGDRVAESGRKTCNPPSLAPPPPPADK
uniref:Uncharacterized protein n=1 Tax=Knipowitschia caucasica TaxID=637954 RepID=A0AAV2JRX9_KNICA